MKKFRIIIFAVIMIMLCGIGVSAEETQNTIKIGENSEYGEIYGDKRNPESGDDSKWITVKPGDSGIRIVGENNNEIVAIDKFGGIYLYGDVYKNNKLVDFNSNLKANGFMYLLIIISLFGNILTVIKLKCKGNK